MALCFERAVRFVTVAEQLSFTRAAKILRMDQPWLSRQVMQLEHQVGAALFDRQGGRIALTDEGVEFYKYAKELAKAAERARAKAEDIKRRTASTLRVGVSNATFGFGGRNRLVNDFISARPKVQLEFSAFAFSDEVTAKVLASELEFGVVYSDVNDADLHRIVIDTADATLCVHREDPLAKKDLIELSDLRERRIAVGLQDKHCARFRQIYSWFDEIEAQPLFVPEGRRFIFDVAESERVPVVAYSRADKIPGSFVRVAFNAPKQSYDICLVRKTDRVLSSAGEQFWRVGQQVAESRLEIAKVKRRNEVQCRV